MSEIKCYHSDGQTLLKRFYQWDVDQAVVVEGVDVDPVPEFHFCHPCDKKAFVVTPRVIDGDRLIAIVPNELFQGGESIMTYIYKPTSNNGARTAYEIDIPLVTRQKPEDYDDSIIPPPAEWKELFDSILMGTYTTDYEVGDTIPLDLGDQGVVDMQIVAIDSDVKSNGESAPITFLSKQILKYTHEMNPALSGSTGNYAEGTGGIGGWEKSEMRSYLNDTIMQLIPFSIRRRIVEVVKNSRIRDTAGTSVNNVESAEKIWLASGREVGLSIETQGVRYNTIFSSNASRQKVNNSTGNGGAWWIRSSGSTTGFVYVSSQGVNGSNQVSERGYGVVPGFCVG